MNSQSPFRYPIEDQPFKISPKAKKFFNVLKSPNAKLLRLVYDAPDYDTESDIQSILEIYQEMLVFINIPKIFIIKTKLEQDDAPHGSYVFITEIINGECIENIDFQIINKNEFIQAMSKFLIELIDYINYKHIVGGAFLIDVKPDALMYGANEAGVKGIYFIDWTPLMDYIDNDDKDAVEGFIDYYLNFIKNRIDYYERKFKCSFNDVRIHLLPFIKVLEEEGYRKRFLDNIRDGFKLSKLEN